MSDLAQPPNLKNLQISAEQKEISELQEKMKEELLALTQKKYPDIHEDLLNGALSSKWRDDVDAFFKNVASFLQISDQKNDRFGQANSLLDECLSLSDQLLSEPKNLLNQNFDESEIADKLLQILDNLNTFSQDLKSVKNPGLGFDMNQFQGYLGEDGMRFAVWNNDIKPLFEDLNPGTAAYIFDQKMRESNQPLAQLTKKYQETTQKLTLTLKSEICQNVMQKNPKIFDEYKVFIQFLISNGAAS